MRETFARRVAVFLLLMLLVAVITSKTGPYHAAFAAVLDLGGQDGEDHLDGARADDSIVTTIVLTLEEAHRNRVGGSAARRSEGW